MYSRVDHGSYRVGDNDARCGPSSIQRFDGEDLAAAERSQAQHQQCYDWWEAQRAQHEAQKAAQAELTLREQEAVRPMTVIYCHLTWQRLGPIGSNQSAWLTVIITANFKRGKRGM